MLSKLTHPDRHPIERKALAQRVTQELLRCSRSCSRLRNRSRRSQRSVMALSRVRRQPLQSRCSNIRASYAPTRSPIRLRSLPRRVGQAQRGGPANERPRSSASNMRHARHGGNGRGRRRNVLHAVPGSRANARTPDSAPPPADSGPIANLSRLKQRPRWDN